MARCGHRFASCHPNTSVKDRPHTKGLNLRDVHTAGPDTNGRCRGGSRTAQLRAGPTPCRVGSTRAALLLPTIYYHIGDAACPLVMVANLLEHTWGPPVLFYLPGEGRTPDHDEGKPLVGDVLEEGALVPVAVAGELGHLEGLEVDPLPPLRQEPHVVVSERGPVRARDHPGELGDLTPLIYYVVLKAGGDPRGLREREHLYRQERDEGYAQPRTPALPGDERARGEAERGRQLQEVVHVRADLANEHSRGDAGDEVRRDEPPSAVFLARREQEEHERGEQEHGAGQEGAEGVEANPFPAEIVEVGGNGVQEEAFPRGDVQGREQEEAGAAGDGCRLHGPAGAVLGGEA